MEKLKKFTFKKLYDRILSCRWEVLACVLFQTKIIFLLIMSLVIFSSLSVLVFTFLHFSSISTRATGRPTEIVPQCIWIFWGKVPSPVISGVSRCRWWPRYSYTAVSNSPYARQQRRTKRMDYISAHVNACAYNVKTSNVAFAVRTGCRG